MTLTQSSASGSSAEAGTRLRMLQASGRLDLPLPGQGRTWERWWALAELSAEDLVVGRLAEAHTDALAILSELAGTDLQGSEREELWGVWAAEPPTAVVTAQRHGQGWRLTGRKAWCSGALVLDRALVSTPQDRRLFAVHVADLEPVPGSWPAIGMEGSGSIAVDLHDVPAVEVGGPGAYLDRPGFWHGGAGVAACWYGGALGAGRVLLRTARERSLDPHALAHLGAVDTVLTSMTEHLRAAASEIDSDPHGPLARLRAARVRAHVEAGATEVLDRVGRALGAGPLCLDPDHARRVADLTVYLRQSHAERDLAVLGELAAEQAEW